MYAGFGRMPQPQTCLMRMIQHGDLSRYRYFQIIGGSGSRTPPPPPLGESCVFLPEKVCTLLLFAPVQSVSFGLRRVGTSHVAVFDSFSISKTPVVLIFSECIGLFWSDMDGCSHLRERQPQHQLRPLRPLRPRPVASVIAPTPLQEVNAQSRPRSNREAPTALTLLVPRACSPSRSRCRAHALRLPARCSPDPRTDGATDGPADRQTKRTKGRRWRRRSSAASSADNNPGSHPTAQQRPRYHDVLPRPESRVQPLRHPIPSSNLLPLNQVMPFKPELAGTWGGG